MPTCLLFALYISFIYFNNLLRVLLHLNHLFLVTMLTQDVALCLSIVIFTCYIIITDALLLNVFIAYDDPMNYCECNILRQMHPIICINIMISHRSSNVSLKFES